MLATLAAGQFLMTLDSSVMNVSIATVANDLGTTVTGIQTAITLYTLVMASLMITGGKIGAIIGYKRAFAIGLVVYGAGSFTTALAPNLTVLLFGWSLLEGIGAALILPAIVALVAANVPASGRSAAYGLVAAAGAIAVAVGPLIGGALTTYASWRWVFAGEVIVVVIILIAIRRIAESPPSAKRPRIDVVGAVLSASGMALFVLGILKAGEWGLVQPKADAPTLAGTSPVIWLISGGLLLLWTFLLWCHRLEQNGGEPLLAPSILRVRQLTGGLTLFGFQFFLQSGIFFTIPLFLSVVLELSAIDTGHPAGAAVDLAARDGRGDPQGAARRRPPARRPGRPAPDRGRDRGLRRRPEPGRDRGDRDGAAAADRGRDRRAGLAAGRGDRLVPARRPGARGGRHPEHRDQPRRVARHGAHRVDPDGGARELRGLRDPREPGHPRFGQDDGERRARIRRAVRVRHPAAGRPSPPRACRRRRRTPPSRSTPRRGSTGCASPCRGS